MNESIGQLGWVKDRLFLRVVEIAERLVTRAYSVKARELRAIVSQASG